MEIGLSLPKHTLSSVGCESQFQKKTGENMFSRSEIYSGKTTIQHLAMIGPERRMCWLMSGLSRGSEMPKDHKSRVLDAALEHTCKKRVMLRRRLFWPKKNCGKSA